MKFSDQYSRLFQYLLPSPFTIAVLLTLVTFTIGFFFGDSQETSSSGRIFELANYWNAGLWNSSLLVFAMQMMLMLVLGHVLALSPRVNRAILFLVSFANTSANAALLVSLSTLMVSFFNWGLGLIFGAIIARKVAEHAVMKGLKINFPLIGAAGYVGLLVWHGGISGSSLVKVAEPGHLKEMMLGLGSETMVENLPNQIPFSETVFSSMNLFASLLCLLLIPALYYLLGRNKTRDAIPQLSLQKEQVNFESKWRGAEKLDHSKFLGIGFAIGIIALCLYLAYINPNTRNFGFISPNYINLLLFGLAIFFHQNFSSFLRALDTAIGGASGILIQFPLYFGIMGIMKSSGLVTDLSAFMVAHSTANSFPILSLFSAGFVNIFIPSGGGQWAIQGPILVQASMDLGISLPKSILAMAYGDQLTNMMQPFWALPLLGITGLKAKDIVPYTLLAMILGLLIFLLALLLF